MEDKLKYTRFISRVVSGINKTPTGDFKIYETIELETSEKNNILKYLQNNISASKFKKIRKIHVEKRNDYYACYYGYKKDKFSYAFTPFWC